MTLAVNHLTGFGAFSADQADATVLFRGVALAGSSPSSWPYSFPSVTIDAADTELLIILVTANDRSLSSATVTGNNSGSHSASILSTVTSSYEFILLHATGLSADTAATVDVTFNLQINNPMVAVWAVSNISATPFTSSSIDSSSPWGSTGDIPNGGIGVALLHLTTPSADAYSPNPAWSNWNAGGAGTATVGSFDYHAVAGQYEGALTANPSLTMTGIGTITASRYCAFTLSPG